MPSRRTLLGAALTFPSLVSRAQSAVTPAQAEISHRQPVPLGNPVLTSSGRLFVSHHPMFETPERVSEILPGDQLRPFPDPRWNQSDGPSKTRLDAVLDIRAMGEQVWMLDMGSRSQVPPKLVVWDTASDQPERTLLINPAALRRTSEPNDFVLDPNRNVAVIADEGVGNEGGGPEAALVVVTFEGVARRVLQGHASTMAEPAPVVVDRLTFGPDGMLYVTVAQLPLSAPLNGGTPAHRAPYVVMRTRPLAPGHTS